MLLLLLLLLFKFTILFNNLTAFFHGTCSIKKGVLRNCAKFTGKHQCKRLCFNKVVGLRPVTILKENLLHRKRISCTGLSCEFWKISKNAFFAEHLRTIASVFIRNVFFHVIKCVLCVLRGKVNIYLVPQEVFSY